MADTVSGFIVHAFNQTRHGVTWICLLGRLENGETFAVIDTRERPGFYLRTEDIDRASGTMNGSKVSISPSPMSTMDGAPCVKVTTPTLKWAEDAGDACRRAGIRTYEADLRFYELYLMEREIHGCVGIRGEYSRGKHVDRVYVDPDLERSSWDPELSVLSLDIETDPATMRVLAFSMSLKTPDGGRSTREVHLWGHRIDDEYVVCHLDEPALLSAFVRRIGEIDPDIITGWNVIDFDLNVLFGRLDHFGIPALIGRSDRAAQFLPIEGRTRSTVVIPGRQALDALRLVRAGPLAFDDLKLQTVALSVLGEGKVSLQEEEETKVDAILRTYQDDPLKLCRYCLRDADLVLDILDKTGMIDLTLKRCILIGIPMSRAWTSIAAFEFLYIEAMHKRRIAAPTLGVDEYGMGRAPGGAILEPESGLHVNVMVFDFKSLYPSIIRTFNIDPVSFAEATYRVETGRPDEYIEAPNGAVFNRSPAILPELLDRFFESRETAKKRGDDVASYVYKIIMNSFYGVLGARGCRFAASDLAGAITSFGQELLHWCKSWFSARGYRVIYGDTDSLFVVAGLPDSSPGGELHALGRRLAIELNEVLSSHIGEKWRVGSRLELEFEKVYSDLFLPPIRYSVSVSLEEQPIAQGRAKGYAGLILPDASENPDREDRVLEIKGMEAIRRDWTDLAGEFQIGLLRRVFLRLDSRDISDYIRKTIKELKAGRYDSVLVYRKALRKDAASYVKNQPPHVQAANMLPPDERKGVIDYIWTKEGPQPAAAPVSPPDYEHYVQKQLRPIAESFTRSVDLDIEELFDSDRQTQLF